MRLVLATSNPGKVRELRRLLAGSAEVLTPAELEMAIEVVEDGETYEANAVKKARAYAEASGCLALADDSGIEVDALDGRPGVRQTPREMPRDEGQPSRIEPCDPPVQTLSGPSNPSNKVGGFWLSRAPGPARVLPLAVRRAPPPARRNMARPRDRTHAVRP